MTMAHVPGTEYDHLITPIFKWLKVTKDAKSELAGREVSEMQQVVEIKFAGDTRFSPVVPVDSMYRRIGNRVVTYAERWKEQYQAFLRGDKQEGEGTSIEELSAYGATPEQISFCRAIKAYTVEAIHLMEGDNLKNLGMHRNSLKEMARRYMADRSSGELAQRELADLRKQIEELKAARFDIPAAGDVTPDELAEIRAQADASLVVVDFETMSDDEIKGFLAEKAGSKPRGNPTRQTLISMAKEYV